VLPQPAFVLLSTHVVFLQFWLRSSDRWPQQQQAAAGTASERLRFLLGYGFRHETEISGSLLDGGNTHSTERRQPRRCSGGRTGLLTRHTCMCVAICLLLAARHSKPYHTRTYGLVVAQAVFCSLVQNDVATVAGAAIWLRRAVRCGAFCLCRGVLGASNGRAVGSTCVALVLVAL